MSEQEENSDEGTKKENIDWLATTNTRLQNEKKQVEMELYHWKSYATDTNERLRRVYQNRNKSNYVDLFYDTQTKKLIKSLIEEKVILLREQGIQDVSILVNQSHRIQVLEGKVDITIKENKQLKKVLEYINSPEAMIKLKKDLHDLSTRNSNLTYENTKVKNQLKYQVDIMNVLKSEFSKQRKEFIKLFMENWSLHGEAFIKQLQSMDGNSIPDFLLKHDIATCTGDDSSTMLTDEKDSGTDTILEDVQHLRTSILEKTEENDKANIKIAHLEEDLCKKNKDSNLKMQNIRSLSEKNKCLENRMKMLEEQLSNIHLGTSTGDDSSLHVPKNIERDELVDSGYNTIPEDVQQLMTSVMEKTREIENANIKIAHLEEELCKTNKDSTINMQNITSLSEKNIYLENRTKMLEEQLSKVHLGTSTGEDSSLYVPKDIERDELVDSGYNTIPEEVQQLMTSVMEKTRVIENANIKIAHLEEELCKKNKDSTINMQNITSLSEKNIYLENRMQTLDKELIRKQNELLDARAMVRKNDEYILNMETVIQVLRDDRGIKKHEDPMNRAREVEEPFPYPVKEPHQSAQWHYKTQSSILVRDGATCRDPSETQDSSPYLPTGPIRTSPPTSPYEQERIRASENISSSSRKPSEKRNFIKCQKCNEMIEADKFGSHGLHCG